MARPTAQGAHRSTVGPHRVPRLHGLLAPCALLLCIAFVPGRAAAQGRTIAIEAFDVDVAVEPTGWIEVTETLRIRFDGAWNGVQRDLSTQHRTAAGRPQRLRIRDIAVTDLAGRALEVERSSEGGTIRLRIRVPDAVDATRAVVIRYRIPNALRFFGDTAAGESHDELYWNATGNGWDMPIRSATVTVRLPAGARGAAAWGYTGRAGSTEQAATVDIAGERIVVRSARPFEPYEGLTVSATWAPGAVARPGARQQAADEVAHWWPAGLPFLALLLMVGFWNRSGREPATGSVAVAYEPPPDLSPAEVGTLIDHRAEMHDLTATVVDLAVRGHLLIEERKDKRLFGLTTSTDYVFHLLPPPEDAPELRRHEQLYLKGLFEMAPGVRSRGRASSGGAGDTVPAALASVRLSALKDRFHAHIEPIRAAVYARLIEKGLYRSRPDRVKARWNGLALFTVLAGIAVTAFSANGAYLAGTLPLLGGFLGSGVIIGFFAPFMRARTHAGAEARRAALGFREFLGRVEQHRLQMMITGPELFERYLPFAMALRVEDRWARAFEGMLQAPPDWYRGTSSPTFAASSFTKGLSSMVSEASRTMASSPSGSSSGSGGGGSSGGGSGGGGGSGF
jgi:hypothetical protein